MTTDTKQCAVPTPSPLLAALENDATVWLDESSQKFCQLCSLFEAIRDTAFDSRLSAFQIGTRIEALAELGRGIADEFAEYAGVARDRVEKVAAEAKKGEPQ